MWAKFGAYRFWPGLILPPHLVPNNMMEKPHAPNEFCVRFFGTLDCGWISRRKVFMYQKEDSILSISSKSQGRLNRAYQTALQEAKIAFQLQNKQQSIKYLKNIKPPSYLKIKTNRCVKPMKLSLIETRNSSEEICQCTSFDENPCGYDSGNYYESLSFKNYLIFIA